LKECNKHPWETEEDENNDEDDKESEEDDWYILYFFVISHKVFKMIIIYNVKLYTNF
jgi:hypothetical protein